MRCLVFCFALPPSAVMHVADRFIAPCCAILLLVGLQDLLTCVLTAQADTGTKMLHIGKNTRSRIISKGISAGNSRNCYRGLVQVCSLPLLFSCPCWVCAGICNCKPQVHDCMVRVCKHHASVKISVLPMATCCVPALIFISRGGRSFQSCYSVLGCR